MSTGALGSGLVCVVVVLLLAAACTNGTRPQSTPPAPSPTIAPPTAAALQTVRDAASRTLALSASVSLDFAGNSSKPIEGDGRFDFASGKGNARIDQLPGPETVVFEPTLIFDHPPPQNAVGLPHGRTWIMAEPAEHVPNSSSIAQFVLQIQGKNPTFVLAELAWGAVAAAPLGPQSVDGLATNGFSVRIDLAAAASAASGPDAAAMSSTIRYEEQMLGVASQNPPPAQTIRAWISDSGRVVQLQSSPPGSGIGTTTMTVTSFGVRVDATRPPRSQTVDVATLAPGGDYDRD